MADGLVDYILALTGNENVQSINPLVGETNDGYLNDIRGRYVGRNEVFPAIRNAKPEEVEEGSVGAGAGTVAFGPSFPQDQRNTGKGSVMIVIAFSASRAPVMVTYDAMSPLFLAAIEATEEAVYNSLFRATTVNGRGHTVEALPIEKTIEILRRHRVVH